MIMKIKNNILFLFLLGLTTVVAQTPKKPVAKKTTTSAIAPKPQSTNPSDGIFAEMETSKGKIIIALEYQKTPITVANFISLSEGTNTEVKDEKLKGKPFYNGLKFHRVIADFMIQGGDPAGNGSGGPGYAFKDEFVSDLKHNTGGILSMANSGPKTNGSQFFITHKETPWLDGKHTVFGHVISGMDVVNAIKQDDVITKVTIVRKGADAKKFDAAKIFSDYMANKSNDDKKEADLAAENKRKAQEAEAAKKAEYAAKYAPVMAAKVKSFNDLKATTTETSSGLKYKIIKKGNGKKPAEGTSVLIHYAGYLEDGSLFDSSYEVVAKEYGKFDENRAKANGYQPFPFQYGNKAGLVPGFIETIENMSYGDKVIAFIPSKLGWGEKGSGSVIPANASVIFEIEMIEAPSK
jgi:peptidyl-prolyl cis-trans isomerase A (cyclophilin A)